MINEMLLCKISKKCLNFRYCKHNWFMKTEHYLNIIIIHILKYKIVFWIVNNLNQRQKYYIQLYGFNNNKININMPKLKK